jgi:microcystin-dependent protein
MLPERFTHLLNRKHSLSNALHLAAFAISLLLISAPAAIAQVPNAWQINDNSQFSGVLEYVTNLTTAQVNAAKLNGWHYSLLSRLLSDTINPASQSMAFGDGTHRFYIYFDLDTSGHLTAQLLSTSNVTYILNVPAPDITRYHLHEMIYDPLSGQATYRFDGNVIASWTGAFSTSQSNQVMWGANASTGQGEMNYHRAEFSINGQGTIALYDAGFLGNPVTAPNPTNQGWTRSASGAPALLEAAQSGDTEFIHPIVLTSNATSLHPGQATLNASINANGWPAYVWFDHGPTTAYGTSTPAVAAGAGTAFIPASALITGLPRGGTYHFRAGASNTVGAVYGTDMSFTVSDTSPISSAPAGGGQPFDIRQPSLELNYIICTNGIYPSRAAGLSALLAEVRLFAGNFAPAGWSFCQGQVFSISNNTALFSLLGTTYGGNGTNTFMLPDFRSLTIVHPGQGPGLSQWFPGAQGGQAQLSLPVTQIPAHTHTLPPPYTNTGSAGGSQPRANGQPSLGLNCLIALFGQFPSPTQEVYEPFVGQMPLFAGTFAPATYAFPSGQLTAVNQNTALFSVLGTNYGGDGITAFNLPNLQSRTPLGSGQGPGLSPWSLGQQTGSESVTMSLAQMPAHQHTVPWVPPLAFLTGTNGSNQPQSVMKPSLALTFLIATNGEMPSVSVQATNKMLGEIQLFAGGPAPGDWSPCNGQLLQVSDYPALFGVLSNFYGGDGIATFALPNLLSRIPVGSADGHPGATYGAEQAALTVAQMPPHTHTVPALDYDRWVSALGLSGANAAFDTDADGDGADNGLEWVTGTNPTNNASFAGLKIISATNAVNIQFPRNTNATDVVYTLQRTSDLSNPNGWTDFVTNAGGVWSPTGVVVETGATNPVNVSVSDARTNGPTAEYRLKLQWP